MTRYRISTDINACTMTRYRISTDINAEPEDRSWKVQKDEGSGWVDVAEYDDAESAMRLWNSLESSKK